MTNDCFCAKRIRSRLLNLIKDTANVEFSEIGRQNIGNATLSAQVSRKLASLSKLETAKCFAELRLKNGEVLVLQFAESKTVPKRTKTAILSMLEPV